MKTTAKIAMGLFVALSALSANAQEVASLTPEKNNTGNPTAPPANPELVITLKNTSELPVVIFAGHKEAIRQPNVQMVGGLSKNTLRLHDNDVVCLMTHELRDETKPIACAHVSATTTAVEIDGSGSKIVSK